MEYPKINSLWKRQDYVKGLPKGKHGPLIIGDYAQPEFGAIKQWSVDEKIDGTNIRIYYGNVPFGDKKVPHVSFFGRTNDAQIPPKLLEYLQATFTVEELATVFPDPVTVVLYGEGYGPKIQSCGGNYRKDQSFILFDAKVNEWWLRRDDVALIAVKLGINMVPSVGVVMSESDIVDYVKSKPKSLCSITEQVIEGVVCRSEPLMLFRNGNPIIWKLKCKEFE